MLYNQTRAIKLKCLECCGTRNEVVKCPIKSCPLWAFRLKGNRPKAGEELEVWQEVEKKLEAERAERASKSGKGEHLIPFRKKLKETNNGL